MKKHAPKIAIGLAFLVFVFLFFYFDLEHYFTFKTIHAERERAVALYDEHPITTFFLFVGAFIAYMQTGVLGTWIIMLGFGAVFGTWVGAIGVGLAYSVGGTIQLLLARYLFRDWVHRRWGERLAKLDAELARDGNWLLLSLRLMSVVPYSWINLGMALTPIKVAPFFWITLAADTFVGAIYTNAGTHLATASRYRDLVDKSTLASVAVVGLFPFVVKLLMERRKKNLQP